MENRRLQTRAELLSKLVSEQIKEVKILDDFDELSKGIETDIDTVTDKLIEEIENLELENEKLNSKVEDLENEIETLRDKLNDY